jgi:hypothetical protein
MMRRWCCMCVVCLSAALLQSGCRHPAETQAAIEGEVQLDGKPIERGMIQFLPMQGVAGSAAGGEIVGGRYRLSGNTGPAIGDNRVEIRANRKTGKMIPQPFPKRGTMEETVEAVPPRYNSASTLTVEVKPGDNTADFPLRLR